jgi:ribosomal biogenesis protein LAS1
VHRHLPSLAELKRAAQDSLAWLWEWYWSQLDYAFGLTTAAEGNVEAEGVEVIREKLQSVLRAYVKERKSEVKAKRKDDRAAETAVSTYNMRYGARYTSTPTLRTQNVLLRLLFDEKMILPTDKKVGSSMSGAFLIWDPLLTRLCDGVVPVQTMLSSLISAMNASRNSMVSADMDPVKEGLYEWAVHVLRSDDWTKTHTPKLVEDTLIQCFSAPTHWNIKLADALLQDGDVPNREQWRAVLGAAKGDAMEIDVEVEMIEEAQLVSMELRTKKEKIKGPQKVVGLWKARPIGWVPEVVIELAITSQRAFVMIYNASNVALSFSSLLTVHSALPGMN